MRIGVYTIALNEAKFARRWAETTRTADYVLAVDTGSTDDTVSILNNYDIDVVDIVVRPWRFDDARNAALSLMPSDLDIVVSLDMDEVLAADWRRNIEQHWSAETTRLRYGYVWNFSVDDEPETTFLSDKICGRFTHRWKAPVHEVLVPTVPEVMATCNEVIIEHRADAKKPRAQYLPLLELAVAEDPHNDRCAHYLAREYYFHGRYAFAIREFQRHLDLPTARWAAERAASMRYIGHCHDRLGDPAAAEAWFIRATLEDPTSREAWVDAARNALAHDRHHAVIAYCQRALALPTWTGEYLSERYARAEGPYDLMSVAYWNLGHPVVAVEYAELALSLNPNDQRLLDNLRKIREE